MSSEEENMSDVDSSEEEEQEEQQHKKRRRNDEPSKSSNKKRSFINQFIEEEADDDDEEDDEEDLDESMYSNEKLEAEEAELLDQTTATGDSSHRRLAQASRQLEDQSAEDIVNQLKKRHQRSQRVLDDEDVANEVVHSEVTQQSLIPSVEDPKLWIFKCKPGREQHIVLAMMNKFIDFMHKGTPLSIRSVVASSTKGFIYVEAEREPHAKEAVMGLRDISPWSMKLVPIHEMTAVMTISSRKKPLEAGAWARMKRAGLYKGRY